jgi:DNA-directed RNA polymerase specialized sigma24 family protein
MMVADHTAADVLAFVAASAARYVARSGGDAEEITQRIMLAIGEPVRHGESEWAYTVTAVRNAVASIARHDRRLRRFPAVPVVSAHSGIAQRDAMSDQERIELRIDIDACLEREGEQVRRLCRLLETMSVAEASRVMNVPRSTLAGWLAGLRDRMEAKGLSPGRKGTPGG